MGEPIHYILGWMGAFVILGALWYLFDRRLGSRLYRIWYAWTHEHPLPPGEERGFLYRRKAKVRFAWAVALSTLQSVLLVSQGHVSPLIEMLTIFFEVPALICGFYLGPVIDRLWTRKDRVLDTLDDLESGDTSLKRLAQDAMERAGGAVRETLHPDQAQPVPTAAQPIPIEPILDAEPIPTPQPSAAVAAPSAPAPAQPAAAPPKPAEPELSPEDAHRAALKRFTGGGGK